MNCIGLQSDLSDQEMMTWLWEGWQYQEGAALISEGDTAPIDSITPTRTSTPTSRTTPRTSAESGTTVVIATHSNDIAITSICVLSGADVHDG